MRSALEVSATFDKPEYRTGDRITVELTVKNVGEQVLPDVIAGQTAEGPAVLQPENNEQWGELNGRGARLEPGGVYSTKLSGYPLGADADSVLFGGVVWANSMTMYTEFSVSAPLTRTYGDAAGIVFADENGNGRYDQGEGVPGLPLTLAYASNFVDDQKTTSGADGAFLFSHIPTVRYTTVPQRVNGWPLLVSDVVVTEAGAGDVRLRAVQPLREVLVPELEFAKDTYEPGAAADITVRLTNHGDIPLTGLIAQCNMPGSPDWINGGPAWGDLSPQAKGVVVPAKQTATFEVTEKVPQAALKTGAVTVACYFTYAGYNDENGLQSARDTALVPGGFGLVQAKVVHDTKGDVTAPDLPGVAGVKVVLVDDRACRLGEKVTDATGLAEFTGVAAGMEKYSLYFYPPAGWMMKSENPRPNINVLADEADPVTIAAAPGEGLVPVLPAPSATCKQSQQPPGTQPSQPPASQPPGTQPPGDQPAVPAPRGKVVKLANTGVDVVGLGTAGVVFLLLGTGAVVASRRRGHPVLHRD